jgi:hypothetical protein
MASTGVGISRTGVSNLGNRALAELRELASLQRVIRLESGRRA